MVVDDRYLLDAGAPLLPHMGRLGIDAGAIEALFVTHFHGDHLLGLPTFILHRAFVDHRRPFVVVGQAGLEDHLERLFALSWGSEWPEFRERSRLQYDEGRDAGEAGEVRYETVRLRHGGTLTRGYRLHLGDRLLAYAGDTQATAELDELVTGADVAITEATNPGEAGVHTSWEQARELAGRHPQTRFFFNHVYAGEVAGAAHDLQVIEL